MRITLYATLALAAALPLPASADNYRFLKDTPVSRFNDEDFRLLNEATKKALATPDLGQPVSFKNEKTGSQGSITPQAGSAANCRSLTVELHHKATNSKNVHELCQVNGTWQGRKS